MVIENRRGTRYERPSPHNNPGNPRLAPLGPKFKAACHAIDALFKTGPMAGDEKKKCLENTKALFPAAF